jgi:H+-transporting ATPase
MMLVVVVGRPEVFVIATTLGGVAVTSSILLMVWGLASNQNDSVFHKLGLPALNYSQVQTMLYLKISLSDFLTVFAARARGPCFERRPGWQLLCAFIFATGCSTFLARFWPFPELAPLNWPLVGYVWLYCLAWFVLQDVVKCLQYIVVALCEPCVQVTPT